MQIRSHIKTAAVIKEQVYARHASTAFNRRMHQILQDMCRELASELKGKLYAVILGGNYGRGDGGSRSIASDHGSGVWSIGEAPAEDIDLLIVAWPQMRSREARIEEILHKYERIFSVPIDLAPIIKPWRLLNIPRRFVWLRLVSNSRIIYGPPKLAAKMSRRYRSCLHKDTRLGWSLLVEQGLRLVDEIAREQHCANNDNPVLHQGKYFREMALVMTVASGNYRESVDLQLHEYIVLIDETSDAGDHLRLLKALLPRALSVLKDPDQEELDFPENWLFHINLWLEAHSYISAHVRRPNSLLLRRRLSRLKRIMSDMAHNNGRIPESLENDARRMSRLLHWTRHHIFMI